MNFYSPYLKSIAIYIAEMIPCMVLSLLVFLAVRPRLKQRFVTRRGLCSGKSRELALLIFTLFMAGLFALTLFPARFWSLYVHDIWGFIVQGKHFTAFDLYPSWTQTISQLDNLHDLLAPLQEVRRALRHGGWLMLMLYGNLVMFAPIGFFSGLLWRKTRWYSAVLVGCATSTFIEFVQFFIGRSTDIDDVILNTTGALLGYLFYCFIFLIFPRKCIKFHCFKREDAPHELSN